MKRAVSIPRKRPFFLPDEFEQAEFCYSTYFNNVESGAFGMDR